jgi:GNAT superfamily N-acetyltransferase
MITHEFKTKEYHYSLYSYLDDKETCYIANVEVYQEFRGKGYGNKLLLDILDKAKEYGYKNIILKCFKNSWKYLWYQRHGFRFYCIDNDDPEHYDWLKYQ